MQQTYERGLDSEPVKGPEEKAELPEQDLEDETLLPAKVKAHIPTQAPASLKQRWGHVKTFEDDKFIGSQLTFDKRPLENYFYRWRKEGEEVELSAGTLPRIDSVKGAFPNSDQVTQVAENMINNEGEILSIQEVWNLNSQRVLSPLIKVEVQSPSQDSGRNSGHEYWFISVNSGKILKRVEADRY